MVGFRCGVLLSEDFGERGWCGGSVELLAGFARVVHHAGAVAVDAGPLLGHSGAQAAGVLHRVLSYK